MQTIEVDGMSCDGRETTVIDALSSVSVVESAAADREAGVATVEGDADVDALVAAIEDAGYDARVRVPEGTGTSPDEPKRTGTHPPPVINTHRAAARRARGSSPGSPPSVC